jgi:subtilisin family serine protease
MFLAGSAMGAGVIDRAVQEQLDRSGPGDTIPIMVLFKDAPAFDAGALIGEGPDARQKVQEALQANAREAQKGFDNFVAADSSVRSVKHFWIVNAVSCKASVAAIEKLAARDDVKAIELNQTIQLEPTRPGSQPKEEALRKANELTYTYGLKKLKIPEFRAAYGLDGQGIVVGHIDTGVDFNHPDLKGKMVGWKDFVGSKPEPYDDQGHGTHTAGTIAGGQTSGLAIGVAPGAKLLVAKSFSGSGSAQTEWLVGAMQWIADPDGNPATNDYPPVCSNSWGGGSGQTTFLEATKNWVRLGIFPCFAAGNSGPGAATVGTPGGFLEAFAVGATTDQDTIASFSSRGPVTWDGKKYVKPDVSAPGENVTSAKNGGGYNTISGTSMACPHVAGMIALMLQASPGAGIDQMRDLLEKTSDEFGEPGKDNVFGSGRVNTLKAGQIAVNGGKLIGKLTDDGSGAGLKGTIKVKENGLNIETGADGSFLFVLPAGSYTLMASAFGYVDSGAVAVQITARQDTPVAIALRKAASGCLSGKILSEVTGEPLQAKLAAIGTPVAAVATGADGSFTIDLPGGTYKFLVTAFGYEPLTTPEIKVKEGCTSTGNFKLKKLPPVLLVNDADGASLDRFFTKALDEAGLKYSTIKSDALGADKLSVISQYSVVVWFTGESYRETLTAADLEAFKSYLASDGSLFVTGQDIAYEANKQPLFKDLFKVKFESDTSNSKQIAGSFSFKIEGGDGAGNQRYPDKVTALAGAEPYLNYVGANNANGGPAGLKIAGLKGKLVYLAFGFEGIDSAASRKAVMADAVAYLMPTQAQRVARIPVMPTSLRAAYAQLMAREASELDAAGAANLAKAMAGWDARTFGAVQQVLKARSLHGE